MFGRRNFFRGGTIKKPRFHLPFIATVFRSVGFQNGEIFDGDEKKNK